MMKREIRRWPVILGIALCVLTLAYSVVLQKAGYLTYLNSDMAAEIILAKQQAQSGHIVEMDWLYSTEIHTLHMNLLYALSFLFTDSYFAARVIGNTIGFVLGMASYVYLCRKLRLSYGTALCTAALLPLAGDLTRCTIVPLNGSIWEEDGGQTSDAALGYLEVEARYRVKGEDGEYEWKTATAGRVVRLWNWK